MGSGPFGAAQNGAPVFGGIFVLFFILFYLLIFVFSIFLYCRISSKTGYSWAMGLLILVPMFGPILLLCILAFTDWPIEKQMRSIQREAGIEAERGVL